MSTVTLWLLISLGGTYYAGRPSQVVERFATMAECQRVADVLNASARIHQCVQATVVRP